MGRIKKVDMPPLHSFTEWLSTMHQNSRSYALNIEPKRCIFWEITPCSPYSTDVSEERDSASFILVSYLVYSSTLKMESACPSETSVEFQRTTRRYIPEDRTLHNHRCENHKSNTCLLLASCWFLAWFILQPWRWRRHVPPKLRLTFNGLQGVVFQKIELLTASSVRTTIPPYILNRLFFVMSFLNVISGENYWIMPSNRRGDSSGSRCILEL
jgi:hypothetical protein